MHITDTDGIRNQTDFVASKEVKLGVDPRRHRELSRIYQGVGILVKPPISIMPMNTGEAYHKKLHCISFIPIVQILY